MKTKSFTHKYITKPLAIALTAGMIYVPFAGKNADAGEGLNVWLNKCKDESKVTATYSIPIPFFGEGKNTKYHSRNKALESQVAGLTQVPVLKGESTSQPYYETYEGNWFTKPGKEFLHGMTTPLHIKNTKADGTTQWAPGYSTVTKEGSIFAPVYGIFASAINGVSKLFGSDYRVYNPIAENPWRVAGTALMEIGAGIAIGNSGGGGSSSSTPTTTTSDPPGDAGGGI